MTKTFKSKNMQEPKAFQEWVALRYQLYNSLFLTLPFEKIHQTGALLPLLEESCQQGYAEDKSPIEIIEGFFDTHQPDFDEEQRLNLLFRLIQYVERQIVLFDAVEDAAFEPLNDLEGKGTVPGLFDRAASRGRLQVLSQALEQFRIRLVLTAHPTQFYPGEVLAIITDLEQAIRNNELSDVQNLLMQLGKTPFINREKPTPYDEAVNLIWYLENVFYHAIPAVVQNIQTHLQANQLESNLPENLISMGFWPGGDRDGNPFVSADTTLKVAERLKRTVLLCHYRAMRQVRRRLTFRGVSDRLWSIERKLYNSIHQKGTEVFDSVEELRKELQEVRSTLLTQHDGLFLDQLDEFIVRVDLFGFHFATLDIRQDSSVIRQTVTSAFKLAGKEQPDLESEETEVSEQLMTALPKLDPSALTEDREQDTLEAMQVMQAIQQKNGEPGSHRFIISNCQRPSDVLAVYGLARASGWKEPKSLDIVPLFETVDDLHAAAQTMEMLYQLPRYRKHLEQRGNKQTIMVGFSDGTKDGGYIMANWGIFTAKEALTAVSRKYGIEVTFFDGRGGPPARGGGRTHNFYASLGSHIEDKAVELTVQGQTISSNFGTRQAAQYNLEQLLSAGLENAVFSGDVRELTRKERAILNELGETSLQEYLNLKSHPAFVGYMEERTPLPYYGMTNIGSRPVKRKPSEKLQLKDLRAIPFVGSWSQMKQNVPGYYGVGKALEKMDQDGRLDELRELYSNSLFFRALLDNSMMALTKSFFNLTRHHKEDSKFGALWQLIEEECRRTHQMVLKVSGLSELMERDPQVKASIQLRDHIVLPLITIQQYALQRVYELSNGSKSDDKLLLAYQKLVMRCMFGNINAARNAA